MVSMPWAMSAPTAASAVVMRAVASPGGVLGGFGLFIPELATMPSVQVGGALSRARFAPRPRSFPVLDKRARACAFPRGTKGIERMHRYRTHTCGALRASDV